MAKKQKLELTWVGKDSKPRLEPRILIEDAEKSYHASARVGQDDIFDNVLIHGDNLLAQKAGGRLRRQGQVRLHRPSLQHRQRV